MCQMGEGVALAQPAFVRDFLISTCKGDRLERDKGDLLRVVEGKTDNRPHLIIVDIIQEGRYQNDLDASLVGILDSSKLDIEQVADVAVTVGLIANSIELIVEEAEAPPQPPCD